MGRSCKPLTWVPLTVLALAALAGCVDEKIVYRDRDLFEEPLAAAGSFLGYTDHSTQLTVCGNCHVEKQGGWEGTAHAHAWETLVDIGQDGNAACQGCHSVSQNGNAAEDPVGYTATFEERYEDVQCESCHGPGLTHVSSPTDANAPLPALAVDTLAVNQGCSECHSGTHHPFAEEWRQSRHGDMSAYPQGRADCESCHTGEGALEAFGWRTRYLEAASVQNNLSNNLPITCAVCHDPHDATNAGQLRFSVESREVDDNLCMKCHQRRAVPELESSGGPHSPQGPLLLGQDVGWRPSNFVYNDLLIQGSHGGTRNQRLCATCHVNSYEVTDAETGDFLVTVTGHRFLPIPCVDSNRIPTEDQSCTKTYPERSFASCVSGVCHDNESLASFLLQDKEDDIAALVDDLVTVLADPAVPPTEYDVTDDRISVAEGATFNRKLGEIESSAIHNPFLTEALLDASIQAVIDEYGAAPPAAYLARKAAP